jgi:hypothetical protein
MKLNGKRPTEGRHALWIATEYVAGTGFKISICSSGRPAGTEVARRAARQASSPDGGTASFSIRQRLARKHGPRARLNAVWIGSKGRHCKSSFQRKSDRSIAALEVPELRFEHAFSPVEGFGWGTFRINPEDPTNNLGGHHGYGRSRDGKSYWE